MAPRNREGVFAGVILLLLCVCCFAEIPVTGRVLDHGKKPVANAEVSIVPLQNPLQRAQPEMHSSGKPAAVALTVTDASGFYRLQSPAAGLWLLRIDARGYVPTESLLNPLLEEYDAGEAVLDTDAGFVISVLDQQKKAVEGALVRIEDADQKDFYVTKPWKRAVRTALSAADGKARLPHAAGESVLLSVSADGFNLEERQRLQASTFSITLVAGSRQSMRVIDAGGNAVSGVLLALGESRHPVDISDEKGMIHAFVAPGASVPALLFAPDARNYQWNWNVTPQPSKELNIRLPQRSRISGGIVDAQDGQTVKNAVVWTTNERWNQSMVTGGKYVMSAPPGSGDLRCAAEGYAEKTIRNMTIPPGETEFTIALDPAAMLDGVVLDPEQKPIPNAQLRLDRGSRWGGRARYYNQLARTLRARKDGTFHIPQLDAKAAYKLTAVAPGLCTASQEFDFTTGARIRKGVRLELKTGSAALGVVVDASNRGVPGATIIVRQSAVEESDAAMASIGTPELSQTASDANGAFHLSGLPPGKVDLEISAHGFATRRIAGIDISPKSEPQDLGRITLKPGVVLMGRILDMQKRAVAGAQIRVGPADPNGAMYALEAKDPDAVSSMDGSFQIADQNEGEHVDVLVTREGYLDLELPAAVVSGTQPLILTLKTASRVSGKILNENGQAIAGAAVNLMRTRNGAYGRREEESDAEGSFLFKDVSPETYSLFVKAAGWQDATWPGVNVTEGKDVSGLKIVLAPEALLEGAVTTTDGSPAIGAIVEMMVQNERFNSGQRSQATTDGSGAYQLHGLKPGATTIQVTHEQYPRLAKEIEIRSGSNHVDFRLSGGNNVSGRVIDETGAAVAGVSVSIALQPRFVQATSDESGIFLLKGIPDGDQHLRVEKEGMFAAQEDITVHVAGASVEGLTITMLSGAEISGSVTGVDAEKLAQVIIEAYDMRSGYRQTRVDHEGSYKLPGISPGHWHLNASLPGGGKHATGDVEIEQGMRQARLDLKFGGGIKLSGTVLRAGEPQAALNVYVEGKEVDSYGSSTTDFAGRFEADGLERGVHTITVSNGSGALRYSQQVDLQQDEEAIVIRIPETHIRGRIIDASDGSPIAGASLSISSSKDEGWSPSNTVSAMDGTFEFRNIGDGEWKVEAKKDGYAAATQNLQLQPDQDVDNMDFSLQPTEGIILLVHLSGGGIPDRITYATLDLSGNSIGTGNIAVGEGGRIKLGSVPAGKWEVLLKAINSTTASLSVSVPQQGPIEITLPPVCSLHVKVPELAAGRIVGKALFTNSEGKIYRDPNPYMQVVPQEREFYSGDIQVYLPPGTWTVRASAPDGRSWSGTATISPTTPGELSLSN